MSVDVRWLLLVALLAVVALLWARWRDGRWSRASRRRNAEALDGEQAALVLLEAAGFRVVERQPWGRIEVDVDGEREEIDVRADLLVEDEAGTWVAEVKTGRLAADLRHGPTRRQLLEYRLAFDVEGVILVDVLAGRVVEVAFPALDGIG